MKKTLNLILGQKIVSVETDQQPVHFHSLNDIDRLRMCQYCMILQCQNDILFGRIIYFLALSIEFL